MCFLYLAQGPGTHPILPITARTRREQGLSIMGDSLKDLRRDAGKGVGKGVLGRGV